MKIKAVCEATGLTDRTVRFYIEEGLVTPKYQQNYLGRKTFDFSDEDIKTLESIAIFRKYGFSVAEIKEIYEQPENIISMAQQAKKRLEEGIAEDTKKIEILSLINTGRTYTPREFAIFLSLPVEKKTCKAEEKEQESKWKQIVSKKIDILFETGAFFLLFGLLLFFIIRKQYLFPSTPWWGYLQYLLSAICVTVCFVWKKENILKRYILPIIALSLCLVLPVKTFLLDTHSFTDDPDDYRLIDQSHTAFDDDYFYRLFPAKPEGFLLDYHYQGCNWEFPDEIFLEVKIQGEENFQKEIQRLKEWYTSSNEEHKDVKLYGFSEELYGSYQCFVTYYQDKRSLEGYILDELIPYSSLEQYEAYGRCLGFAYDDTRNLLRYFYYHRRGDAATPYHLTANWKP